MNKRYNLLRVSVATPRVKVADVKFNVEQIIKLSEKALQEKSDFILFPELSVTGYTCQDLFLQGQLLEDVKRGIKSIESWSIKNPEIVVIVGAPEVGEENGVLYNSAYIFKGGGPNGIVRKRYLPGYKEFYEPRWFTPDRSKDYKVFEIDNVKFGIEICEDVWSPCPPSTYLAQGGAEVIFNLSASNELTGKYEYLKSLLSNQSARLISGYVYASSGYGESGNDLVYSGKGFIYENGKELAEFNRFRTSAQDQEALLTSDIDLESIRLERLTNKTFQSFLAERQNTDDISYPIYNYEPLQRTDDTKRTWNAHPFVPSPESLDSRCYEILEMQKVSLMRRLESTGLDPVIGVSGGSDSTWALLVAYEAAKELSKEVIGVTMPGFATSDRTYKNSKELIRLLCSAKRSKDIDIKEICRAHLKAHGHPENVQDITYENIQARTRTQILMDLANYDHGLVIGTGDLSEIALGWCTYNADQMSMYGINCSVPKTLIKTLIKWYLERQETSEELRKILTDILDTPVSPELTGSNSSTTQVTEDIIGPYELHDFFLYNKIRHGFGHDKLLFIAKHSDLSKKYIEEEIEKWLEVFEKRFKSQQFKRENLPDGPKIGSISLSQRGDWRMPSDL